jgi:formylglycine-generating enzyme required for sulfatase activity
MTHPVGQKEPNAFGLYDMHGNVWQQCEDFFGFNYYKTSPTENPGGPTKNDATRNRLFGGYLHSLRGGSWEMMPNDCRATHRVADFYGSTGFRVVVPTFRTP